MDNAILKKRLNTYRTSKTGQLRGVSDEVIVEVLRAWESWSGTSRGLCQSLGIKSHQMVNIIKQGKNLIKSGAVTESEFKEIKMDVAGVGSSGGPVPCQGIELVWDGGKLIRFGRVDELLDFMKRAA
jgi:hypothetical protein